MPDAKISEPQKIDSQLSDAAQALSRQTPPARRVRIAGRLDLLGVSKRVLGIILRDGSPVTGVWKADGFIHIANFLDKQVLIEGLAQFRPSGAILRIDTDAIREAGPKDDSFSVIPVPELRRNYQPEAVSARPGQQPFASIFGMIPGDETDEEYAAAVNALS